VAAGLRSAVQAAGLLAAVLAAALAAGAKAVGLIGVVALAARTVAADIPSDGVLATGRQLGRPVVAARRPPVSPGVRPRPPRTGLRERGRGGGGSAASRAAAMASISLPASQARKESA
jgi:hypothetical protein